LHADAIWRYFEATGDRDFVMMAYPLLCQEYRQFWLDPDHSTPTGLATHNDTTDPFLRRELAAEAETGLDFCALFEGDVRRHVPIALNCQLVRYCEVLGLIADQLGFAAEAETWRMDSGRRAETIRQLCWDESAGFFLEYDFRKDRRGSVRSLCAYWTVWAGVATAEQTSRLIEHLPHFEFEHGLAVTDKLYPSPHPEFPQLQWAYPFCWPPLVMMVVTALERVDEHAVASRVGTTYLEWVLECYRDTGTVWEKYLAVPATSTSDERYETVSFYGWSAASVVDIGRIIGLDR
jgi:alpha,alpha-trehalase